MGKGITQPRWTEPLTLVQGTDWLWQFENSRGLSAPQAPRGTQSTSCSGGHAQCMFPGLCGNDFSWAPSGGRGTQRGEEKSLETKKKTVP